MRLNGRLNHASSKTHWRGKRDLFCVKRDLISVERGLRGRGTEAGMQADTSRDRIMKSPCPGTYTTLKKKSLYILTHAQHTGTNTWSCHQKKLTILCTLTHAHRHKHRHKHIVTKSMRTYKHTV